MSGNIYEHFHSYSVALDDNTDDHTYFRGVDDNFGVIEGLFTMIPMHGQTTGLGDILPAVWFHCGCRVWKSLAGITPDREPSMTGRRNGLTCKRPLLCTALSRSRPFAKKGLKFDNVMSDVVKCINHIRSKGLKGSVPFWRKYSQHMRKCFTKVCWLSRWRSWKRYFELRAEVEAFVEKDGLTVNVLNAAKQCSLLSLPTVSKYKNVRICSVTCEIWPAPD